MSTFNLSQYTFVARVRAVRTCTLPWCALRLLSVSASRMMSPKRLRPEAEKERATASSPDSPPTEEAFVSSCTYCATLFSRQQNHCVFNKSSKRPCRSAFSDNVLQYTSVQECSSCASQCCCLSEAASCAVPLSVCQKRTAYSSPASCSLTPPARLHCCDTLKKSVAEAANIFRAPSTQRLCPILASETSGKALPNESLLLIQNVRVSGFAIVFALAYNVSNNMIATR